MYAAAVFFLALSLRLLHFLEIRGNVLFQNPMLDSRFYYLWAQEIVNGDWVGHSVFVLNPGYAYFLAILFKLHQAGITLPVLVQSVLGALSCVVVYRLAATLFDLRTALLAAAFAALYPVSILYDGLLVTACIVHFLNVLALYLLLTAKTRWQLIFSGALIGMSALFRPTVLAFVPFVLIWLVMRRKRDFMICFIAGCAIVLFPVLARNFVVGRQLVIASAGLGMNFFIGNNPLAVGTYARQPFESGDPQTQVEEYRQEASRIAGRILTDAEASTFWLSRAVKFITQHPVQFCALLLKKAALFINRAEIPTNMNLGHLQSLSFLRYLAFLSFGTLFPLAFFGMLTAGGAEAQLLKFYAIAYFLANLLFFVGSEYRYPVVSVVFIFCASALARIVRARSIRGLVIPAFGLAALGGAANLDLYQDDLAVLHNNIGNIYIRQECYDDAVAEYAKALEIDPRHVPARENLAAAYFNRQNYTQAILEYKKILEINRFFPDTYYYLGLSYYNLGDPGAALPYFKRALELKPDWREARTFRDLAEGTMK